MKLNEYPQAIAKLQAEVFNFDVNLEQSTRIVKQIEAEIDSQVAFDSSLRNDAQRKAKRQELLDEHDSYWERLEGLEMIRNRRETSFIELCRLRNEFSVLKLEKREMIARLELQANQ